MKRSMFVIGLLAAVMLFASGCVTENKAVGISEASDGLAARVSSNPAAGGSLSMLPEAIWIQTCFSYASSPFVLASDKTQCARVFTMAKKKSFLGSLFGIDDSAETMSYIGNPNDTAEQTVAILNAAASALSTPSTKSTESTAPK